MYLKLHIQPSELDELEYYEFHYLIKDLIEHIKEENKQTEKQNAEQSSAMGGMTPKMPNMSMPKINMPKF